MRATRAVRNPNLQVVITHALPVCSHHSIELPLRMNGIQRTQFGRTRFGLLPHRNLTTRVLTMCQWDLRKAQFAVSEFLRELGRVSNLNLLINWHQHTKGHVEVGYFLKFVALRLNRDQVMTPRSIQTSVILWQRPPKPYKLFFFSRFLWYSWKWANIEIFELVPPKY